jgi:hypothetical protein
VAAGVGSRRGNLVAESRFVRPAMRNMSTPNRVTMPKWPAWVLFATMAACAYPAVTASADAAGKQPAPAASPAPGPAAIQPSSLASAFAS